MPAPSFSPVGDFAIAFDALARLVASSQTFRNVVGANNADEAMQFIAWHETDDSQVDGDGLPEFSPARPRAIIRFPPGASKKALGLAVWGFSGSLDLSFEFVTTDIFRHWGAHYWGAAFWGAGHWAREICSGLADEYQQFLNLFGRIINEMADASHAGTGLLHVDEFPIVFGPEYSDERFTGEKFYRVVFSIAFNG